MLTPILTILHQPASRRKWLTIISGSLIVLGLIALYGFDLRGLWAASMLVAAFVAGSDIAWRAFHALRIRHFSIELLVTVAAIGALAGYIAAEAILAPLAHPLHWLIAMIVAVASYFTVLF